MKFTVHQIEAAHDLVKTGSDFPKYIQDIIKLGVTGFETFVNDSHTRYFGADGYEVSSDPQYALLNISDHNNTDLFVTYLKAHQKGASDYFTFCKQCAETGVAKWIVNLTEMTCTYYDKAGTEVLVEQIPA